MPAPDGDIPGSHTVLTFQGDVRAETRVLRSDSAVLDEWNGNHGVVACTPSQDIQSWVGEAGPQPGTGAASSAQPYHLPGGGEQVWIDRPTIPPADLQPGTGRWQIRPTDWADRGAP